MRVSLDPGVGEVREVRALLDLIWDNYFRISRPLVPIRLTPSPSTLPHRALRHMTYAAASRSPHTTHLSLPPCPGCSGARLSDVESGKWEIRIGGCSARWVEGSGGLGLVGWWGIGWLVGWLVCGGLGD